MNRKTLAIALIIIGVLMIGYNGFNYFTAEKVVEIGNIEITKKRDHSVQWSPLVGIAILIGGIILIFPGRNIDISTKKQ